MEQKPYINHISITADEDGGWQVAMRGFDVGKASREAVGDGQVPMIDALNQLTQPLVDLVQPLHSMEQSSRSKRESSSVY